MTIASELTKLNTNLGAAYTAVNGKGGTLPQAQNFDNLATAISSIPSGSSPVITSLSVTPTTSSQTITAPSGTDGYSPVNVAAVTSSIDANITAGNIKKDVSILGVTGTLESGITPSGTLNVTQNGTYDVTNYASAEVSVSGGGSHTRYKLLDRVYSDANAPIGTVSGFFTDKNDVEYAVVCLDATYRNSSAQWASATGAVTNMPLYSNWTIWEAPETATENTTLILASKTSSACTHCRSKSFTIGGVTYYGQLPNIIELVDIARHRTAINAADTSGGSIRIAINNNYWSSSQYNPYYGWCISNYGSAYDFGKTTNYYVCPVLEIPNTL